MKIIAFAGSPRIGGNSDLLLDQVIAGAKDAGAEVEKVYLNKLNIRPCQACDGCRRPGATGCVVKDDMQPLYDKLLDADAWVLATPVYWWGPSAQLKLMVDRWYGFYRHHREEIAGRQAALVVTMGDDEAKTAHPTKEMFQDAFDYLKMELVEPLVVTASDKGEVKTNSEALANAYRLGKSLVK
ncbi:MAG: flavodoxin family protein [Bacillota bacterium]